MFSKKTGLSRSLRARTSLGLAAALLMTSAGTATAESSRGLVGAWSVQVTLRDCTSGAPIGSPFNALVSFHEGGTISESAGSSGFAIGQRGPGHGTWSRKDRTTFRQKMIALILFDTAPNLPGTPGFDPTKPVTPGFFAGWQTVTHTVDLVDADNLSSSGTNAFYKTTGELYRTGCSTAIGQRFK
ncbi:MAG TPA: hypothetical protein VH740_16365 [Vicinamibacterales bacterium]|jgi:hypothetical protein